MYSLELEEQLRKILSEDMARTLDDAAFDQLEAGTKLLNGEGDSYEGIRFIESPHIKPRGNKYERFTL